LNVTVGITAKTIIRNIIALYVGISEINKNENTLHFKQCKRKAGLYWQSSSREEKVKM
jgi:hypothetical protein